MDIFSRYPPRGDPSTCIYQASPRHAASEEIQIKQPPPTTRKIPTIHDDESLSSWAIMDAENPHGSTLLRPKGHLPTSDASISLNSWANMDTDHPEAFNLSKNNDRLQKSDGVLRYGGQTMMSTKPFRGKTLNMMNEKNFIAAPHQPQHPRCIPENDDQSVSLSSWANLDVAETVRTSNNRKDVLHQSDSFLHYNRPGTGPSNLICKDKLKTSCKKKSRSHLLVDQAPTKPDVKANRSASMNLQKMNQNENAQALPPPPPPNSRDGSKRKPEKRKLRVPFLAGRRWSTGHSLAVHQ